MPAQFIEEQKTVAPVPPATTEPATMPAPAPAPVEDCGCGGKAKVGHCNAGNTIVVDLAPAVYAIFIVWLLMFAVRKIFA